MSIFAIGDLHLSSDPSVKKPMSVFGSAWEDHEERLKKSWSDVVMDGDTVLIPGDVSWGLKTEEAMADLEWIHRLPGKKIFIKGNHDLWWVSSGRLNGLYPDMIFLQNHAVKAGETWICGTRGWICPGTEGFDEHDQKIYNRELIRLRFSLEDIKRDGEEPDIIVMLHYPPCNDRFQPSGFTGMLEEYGVRTCVYGHLHGQDNYGRGLKGECNGVDYRLVSLDALGACPVRIRP